ncbi:HNH endonuclease signature motif containing protein [Tsukamurella soli]|uniref:HNH endonuclease signature motif containing protein n=1 Tax=Tsukamurella soli TaxID=644556 RepID=A0ABP8J3X0_9ACTN
MHERISARRARGLGQKAARRGIAREVGLALHISHHHAKKLVHAAEVISADMPHTLARVTAGDLSQAAVHALVATLDHLDSAERRIADQRLCADPATLAGLGLRRLADKAEAVAYELDAEKTLERAGKAAADRHVSIRPCPDTMARVSILLPVAQAVGIYAALTRAADGVAGHGTEPRGRGQVMADEAYARITGRAGTSGPSVAVNLTVSDAVLLGGANGTAHLEDGGVLPGEIARRLVAEATADELAWVRRLYVTPATGAVVGMDAKSRTFPAGLARLIRARDRYCRTPYCDAPIADIDHVQPWAEGGPTTAENGQGLCKACNLAKQAHGWHDRTVVDPSGRHTVETRTPAGTVHRSTAAAA